MDLAIEIPYHKYHNHEQDYKDNDNVCFAPKVSNKKIHFDWEFTENKHIKNMFRINNHHNFQNSNKFSKYFK
jgi:hypothetical protein